MSEKERLGNAVKLIAWGYILVYININLGTLNVLPNWLGMLFMLRALPALGEDEESAKLLRPLAISMAVWESVKWAAVLFGISVSEGAVGITFDIAGSIISVISMYFHFQLLTNLANAAEKYGCSQSRKILRLRTVNTILILILSLPLPWYSIETVAFLIILAMAAVTVWIWQQLV